MRIVFFVSGGGGNLGAGLRLQDSGSELLEIVAVVSDRPEIPALDLARSRGISVFEGRFEDKCGRWQDCREDPVKAERYRLAAINFHDEVLDWILEWEVQHGASIDLAVLSYRRWVHGRLLGHFSGRMINQHAGDLTVWDAHGKRKLIGVNPVLASLQMGFHKTRTSTIMVGDGHDTGEIVCQGPWVPFTGSAVNRETALEHEMRQKEVSDWPSLQFALQAIAQGRLSLSDKEFSDGCRVVCLDDQPLPYGGVDLDSSGGTPNECSDRR